MQIGGRETAVEIAGALEHVVALGDDLAPVVARRALRIDGEDPPARRAAGGEQKEAIVERLDHLEPRILAGRHRRWLPVAVPVDEVDLALRPPLGDAHDQPAPVGRQIDAGPVGAIAAVAEDLVVVGRIVAEVVQEDAAVIGLLAGRHLARLGVARVEEAAAVGQPGERAGARAGDSIGEVLPAADVAHAQQRLLVAVVGGAVGDARAVVGGEPPVERARPVGPLLVDVDQRAIGALETVAQVEDRLVLRAVAARVEVAAFLPLALALSVRVGARPRDRHAERSDREESAEPRLQRRASWKRVERFAGGRVLRLGPAHDGGRVALFEPAERIGSCSDRGGGRCSGRHRRGGAHDRRE